MRERLNRFLPARWRREGVTVPVVRLAGMIGISAPLRPGLTLAGVAATLERAFAVKSAPVVALLVNSPGGSPVQSHLIFKRIRDLSARREKKVAVFVEDIAASGGYMIAAAGDEIIADPASIVGSIGVASQGFGFVGLIDKLGVERRLYTSGEHKGALDPFRPENAEDVAHLKALQADVHADFIGLVKERRGERLAADDDLFSGLFWSGRRAQALGLVDGLGDVRGVMTERYGKDVRLRLMQPARGLFWRRPGFGVEAADRHAAAFIGALEERLIWSRYGL